MIIRLLLGLMRPTAEQIKVFGEYVSVKKLVNMAKEMALNASSTTKSSQQSRTR
jgi:hypothetical protein